MELEKQAELYEKNAQSDIVKEIFTQMLKGDNPFENLAVGLNEFERIKKIEMAPNQSKSNGKYKRHSKRRKK
ncbi:hypothetical protein B4064_2072 [Caldibacillus thermoamylovorans]|uniref:Uncharacterized protein n=1 Tax=Caldibacillus thermoamylovorans TaxID=35841 RepID=A0A090IUM0_9BACI|nr:hypothetical protein [Caldibacillus thermoamylovorans]KIO66751.1 hypothetical protein B4064_2072 [Caldibacillus thermoamylovorans]CEE00148.1 hypothetical protein BT1A1_0287 [Caldibacillus thermoamylovorans]